MKTERKQSVQKDEPQKATQLRGSHRANGEPQNEYHALQESRRGTSCLAPVPLPCLVIEGSVTAVDPESAAAGGCLPTAGLAVERS